jgi:hypothetical protein
MTCDEIIKLLPDYAVDNVSNSLRESISAHLSRCPDCAREMEMLKRTEFLVNTMPLVEPPVGLWEKVEAQIRIDEICQTETKAGWNIVNWLKLKPIPAFVTTAVVFFILGGLWCHYNSITTQPPIQVIAIEEPIETYIAQHNAAALEDPATDKNGAGILLVTAEEINGEN